MSLSKLLNTSNPKFTFDIPETHEFKSPKDLFSHFGKEQIYNVKGMYVNTKGKFGDEPVLILDICLLNAPKHTLEAVNTIRTNDEHVKAVNDGKLGIKLYTYDNQYGTQYGVEWIDLKPA